MAAIDFVKPTDFYSDKSEKIKLNWFLYELAMAFFSEVETPLKKIFKSRKMSDEAIARFAVQAALALKEPILNFSYGKTNVMEIEDDFFSGFLPPVSDKNHDRIFNALLKGWDSHLALCEVCPTRCISEWNAYCSMFDTEVWISEDADWH